jgi:hypothetical protein
VAAAAATAIATSGLANAAPSAHATKTVPATTQQKIAKPAKPVSPQSTQRAKPDTVAGYQLIDTLYTVAPGTYTYGEVECPAGTNVLGGGERNMSNSGAVLLTDSFPTYANEWIAYVRNDGPVDADFYVYATCG